MFGCLALYSDDERLFTLLCDKEEPWNGILIATGEPEKTNLLKEFQLFKEHPVLKKWIYLSQNHPDFERQIEKISQWVLQGKLQGVVGKKRSKKRRSDV